jgi:UDPglucose 6-dehydrogenase
VIRGKRIGVLGLAFKPTTDDVRFSPAVELIQRLLVEGARVQAYDPEAMEKARAVLPNVELCESAYQAANGADALVIAHGMGRFPQSRLGKDLRNHGAAACA